MVLLERKKRNAGRKEFSEEKPKAQRHGNVREEGQARREQVRGGPTLRMPGE